MCLFIRMEGPAEVLGEEAGQGHEDGHGGGAGDEGVQASEQEPGGVEEV